MRRLLLCLYFSLPFAARAEGADDARGSDAPFEVGFHLGELLPNQIKEIPEIMGLGGVRVGYRMAPLTYAEGGFIFGNGEGQEWRNGSVSLRLDFPVSNLVGLGYVGGDVTNFKSIGRSDRIIFGGHAGGGIQAHLLGSCWFRGDMKFTFSPGTALYFGFGLTWRLAGN